MKIYQVVRRGSTWHALVPDATPPVVASENKAEIVAWACDLARQNGGAVQIRDIGGQIETTYTYVDGVEKQHDRVESRRIAASLKK